MTPLPKPVDSTPHQPNVPKGPKGPGKGNQGKGGNPKGKGKGSDDSAQANTASAKTSLKELLDNLPSGPQRKVVSCALSTTRASAGIRRGSHADSGATRATSKAARLRDPSSSVSIDSGTLIPRPMPPHCTCPPMLCLSRRFLAKALMSQVGGIRAEQILELFDLLPQDENDREEQGFSFSAGPSCV